MDAFLLAAKNLADQILPTLGVIVLVFVCVMVYQLIKLLQEIRLSLKDVGQTVDLVNESLEKAQVPLNTVVNISETVDKVQETGVVVIKEAAQYLVNNFHTLKDYLNKDKEKGN